MGYNHFRYARKIGTILYLEPTFGAKPQVKLVDNSYIALICHSSSTIRFQQGTTAMVTMDYASNVTTIAGGGVTGDDLKLKANTIDARPFLTMRGNAGALLDVASGAFEIGVGGSAIANVALGGGAAGGVLKLLETTTPTATPDYGAIYTKADNHLYWQSGAGVEYDLGGA